MRFFGRLPNWTLVATGVNEPLAAAVAAVPNVQHFITRITASFSDTPIPRLLTVQDGSDIIYGMFVTGLSDLPFSRGRLRGSLGQALAVNVGSAGAGVSQTVSVIGYSSRELTEYS